MMTFLKFIDSVISLINLGFSAWNIAYLIFGDVKQLGTSYMSDPACVHFTRCPIWRQELQVTLDAKFAIRAFCGVGVIVGIHFIHSKQPGDVDSRRAETIRQTHQLTSTLQ